MSYILPYDHSQFELAVLRLKIEKLEAWMFLYRSGKITSKYVIEIIIMLNDSYREQKQLLNNLNKQ